MPLTHTLLLTVPILAMPILADTPLTHPALTRDSHSPRKLPVHPSPCCTHPLAFPGHPHHGKGSGGDAGWNAGHKFEGLTMHQYITLYNISCNQFQPVEVMQKTSMDQSIPVLVWSLPDAHLEGLVLVMVATI